MSGITQIWEMSPAEAVRVQLPYGIGHVEIRTGNVHGPTGYPVVAAEMVSYAKHRFARDGRLYEPQTSNTHTVLMVGRPVLGHIHKYELSASWPEGPDGETGTFRVCSCGDSVTATTTYEEG